MRRRAFIAGLGSALIGPMATHGQQPVVPVVGFLRSTPSASSSHLVTAFRNGLTEAGFVEGQNVAIEYRWADNRLDQLPSLAADLVRRQVAVIIGNGLAMQVVKAATATIPIVFVSEHDPVRSGLVASLSRPGGNVTGVTFSVDGPLDEKHLELLDELAPKAATIAVLFDPNALDSEGTLRNVGAASRALGRQTMVVTVASEHNFDDAFARLDREGAGALLVTGSPLFTSRRQVLVELAARYAIPASYYLRDYVEAGGLMSYGASISGSYRQAGLYVGRILKGANPADLPVLRATKFELIINLKTAKALGLAIPSTLLARADEIIE